MSEVENSLPDNWALCKLGDVMKLRNGYAFKSKDYSAEGVPLIRISDINNNIVSTERAAKIPVDLVHEGYLIEDGDLLIAMSGATTGKTGVYKGKEKILQNQRVGNFKIIDEAVVSKGYRNYYVMSLRKAIEGAAYGGAQPNIAAKDIDEFPFPLAPPEQQKRIVAKIEELFSHIDAGIAALKKAKQLLKQYRQSILKAAVTGELTKQWREDRLKDDVQGSTSAAGAGSAGAAKLEPASQLLERILQERRQKWEAQQLEQFKAKGKMPKDDQWKGKYKEPLGFNYDGELPEIPKTWTWASPEQLASTDKYALSIGPFGSNLKVPDYRSSGVPLVFVRNIRRHEYGLEGGKFVTSEKAKELKAHAISGGDVLITKMGEPPGDASIYPAGSPDAIITADCIKWRFSRLIECPHLYVHAINSWLIKEQIIERTKGVAQKKISLGTFKSVALPLAPLEEQKVILGEIEKKIFTIDRLEKDLVFQLSKTEKNKQSILVSAFSGALQ
jgi:type I restriction enzyme S subunit